MKRSNKLFRHLPRMTFIMILLLMTAQGSISVQAASKSIYVISKIVRTNIENQNHKLTNSLSYNKKGLITRQKETSKFPFSSTASSDCKYTYNKKNRFVKAKFRELGEKEYKTMKYKLDKKGRVKSINDTVTYKYNSKGYLKSVPTYGNSFSYNSKGQLVKVKNTDSTTITYTYDSHGMLASEKNSSSNGSLVLDYSYVNTYDKNGCLTKQVKYWNETDEETKTVTKNESSVVTFSYKKISVPSSMVTRIKAQQKYLYLYYGSYAIYYPPLEGMYK